MREFNEESLGSRSAFPALKSNSAAMKYSDDP
jgi:hypothetical protein